MLPPGAIFKLKIHQNAHAARALPDPLAGFQRAASRQGREKGGAEGREGGKGEGIAFPNFFFTT